MPLVRLTTHTFLPLNDYAVEQLTNTLTGNWANIIANAKTFLRVYNFVLLPIVALSSLGPIARLIFSVGRFINHIYDFCWYNLDCG